MAIKIVKPTDPILTANITMVIYGVPGAGKTSLGFSTDKPLLIDFDLGAQRGLNRKDVVQVKSWTDIMDLMPEDLTNYNTLVIDTIGRVLESMASDIIKSNPRLENKANGGLSLQGYGALGIKFKNFIIKLKSFNKDLVLLCHQDVEKIDEALYITPKAVGKSKEYIFEAADLMGYVFMDGKKRMIDFNPSSNHLGKNCAEIPEQEIANLNENKTFLADLITLTKEKMNAKSAEMIKAEEEFNQVLDSIDEIDNLDACNVMLKILKDGGNPAHKQALMTKAKALGFVFNKAEVVFELEAKDELA